MIDPKGIATVPAAPAVTIPAPSLAPPTDLSQMMPAVPMPVAARARMESSVKGDDVKRLRTVDQDRRRRVDHPLGCDDAAPSLEARSEA